MTELHSKILRKLNEEIFYCLTRLSSEETHPQFDPDKMDDTIRFYNNRIQELRVIRINLETILTTSPP